MSAPQPFAERDYYSDPRRKARTGVVRALSTLSRRAGVDVESRDFYSPVPQMQEIPSGFFQDPSEMPGVAWPDVSTQLDFVEAELAEAIKEFTPPREWTGQPNTYFLDNGLYQGGDADLLYGVIRALKPARVLELGAGFSTIVSGLACHANAADGHETRLISCDPYAIPPAPGQVPGLTELRPVTAQGLPFSEYESLEPGDVLFIDSSHTVKMGGDVTHLFGEVLPRLPDGVLVHVHDVYLPWNYPREYVTRNRWYWAEQYLLQAFLAFNDRAQVLVSAFASHRGDSPRLAQLIPNYRPSAAPLSLWLRIGPSGE